MAIRQMSKAARATVRGLLAGFFAVAAFWPAAMAADSFSVGCVNCGAFRYGGGRATPEKFAEE